MDTVELRTESAEIFGDNTTTTHFSLDSIASNRIASLPIEKKVGALASSDLFKSHIARSKPPAKGTYCKSHLTPECRSREPSLLKGAMKYFCPNVISLCGGLPSPEYFPFSEVTVTNPKPSAFDSAIDSTTTTCHMDDVAQGTSDLDLHIALNYGPSTGLPQLIRFLTEHTEIIHSPPYSDWNICLTQGSTSALEIVLRMFCERGQTLLMDDYAFSSAIQSARPLGIIPVGVEMDSMGMCPTSLDEILSNWETRYCQRYDGAAKPKVMYLVPTGQNPTGATQNLDRRKAIYEVCDKHNIFIIEDEPYYFLQMDPYVSCKDRETAEAPTANGLTDQQSPKLDLSAFIKSLVPSYLHLDTSGRVLRMDSFSKTIAPGTRAGWVTAHKSIIERFVRATEVSTQNPSGFSLIILYKLLEEQWGHQGFLQWLFYLGMQYSKRRDIILDACEKDLPTTDEGGVCEFVAPVAGMFLWITIDGSRHPRYQQAVEKAHTEGRVLNEVTNAQILSELEDTIFLAAVQQGVLVARGSWFKSDAHHISWKSNEVADDISRSNNEPTFDTRLYFRMTFAAASALNVAQAVRRFGHALRQEFNLCT